MGTLSAKVSELMINQKYMLEAIKYLDDRFKDILEKIENEKTDHAKKILDNSDDIAKLQKSKDENDIEIKRIEDKIQEVDKEIIVLKNNSIHKDNKDKKVDMGDKVYGHGNSIKCKICGQTFSRFVDLEKHLKTIHGQHQKFSCDKCKKGFMTKWRLEKHMKMHTEGLMKQCHYFNNGGVCPFEEFGCKFSHILSKLCIHRENCKTKLCPFRHEEEEVLENDTKVDSEESNSDEDDMTNELFKTSTPRKRKFSCDECHNKSQCVDCFVGQVNARTPKVHFEDDSS